mmetsp:Transcript_44052/g.115766  ORF Transcript_44052/g.115766 Transcript_44052/m.115766 type:complete len:99 (+) Transcript_44052:1101-1397(+)
MQFTQQALGALEAIGRRPMMCLGRTQPHLTYTANCQRCMDEVAQQRNPYNIEEHEGVIIPECQPLGCHQAECILGLFENVRSMLQYVIQWLVYLRIDC